MFLQRVAKALLERTTTPTAVEPEVSTQDDVLEFASEFFIRQHRRRARVYMGAEEGIPLVGSEASFRKFMLAVLAMCVTREFKQYPFYLLCEHIDAIHGWDAMEALRVGFGLHGAMPLVVPTRDIHVIENYDFFLCNLHVVLKGE